MRRRLAAGLAVACVAPSRSSSSPARSGSQARDPGSGDPRHDVARGTVERRTLAERLTATGTHRLRRRATVLVNRLAARYTRLPAIGDVVQPRRAPLPGRRRSRSSCCTGPCRPTGRSRRGIERRGRRAARTQPGRARLRHAPQLDPGVGRLRVGDAGTRLERLQRHLGGRPRRGSLALGAAVFLPRPRRGSRRSRRRSASVRRGPGPMGSRDQLDAARGRRRRSKPTSSRSPTAPATEVDSRSPTAASRGASSRASGGWRPRRAPTRARRRGAKPRRRRRYDP